MGRKKDKEANTTVVVLFYLEMEDNKNFIEEEVALEITEPVLRYENLIEARNKFLMDYGVYYETYMYYTTPEEQTEMIDN